MIALYKGLSSDLGKAYTIDKHDAKKDFELQPFRAFEVVSSEKKPAPQVQRIEIPKHTKLLNSMEMALETALKTICKKNMENLDSQFEEKFQSLAVATRAYIKSQKKPNPRRSPRLSP